MRISTPILFLLLAQPGLAEPQFTPVPAPNHVYDGGWEHFVGGGLASFDCNDDGLPELYAAGGSNPAQLLINHSPLGGKLDFQAETPQALALSGVIGAYPLDIDGDSVMDLAVLRVGADQLLRGLGACQFAPFDTLGFESGDHWSTAFSATWEKGQTLPTLAFGTYVDRSDPQGPFETCDATLLYRPEQGRYGPVQALRPGFCALSMLFTDWGRTGQADLRISNDRHYYVRGGQEQMWAMHTPPRLYSEAEGWHPYQIWGMGIASRDLNSDGFADVFLTSMGDQKLQYFDGTTGQPRYKDATYARGTTAHRPYTGGDGRPSTGWHAAFGDINNDGYDDVFITKGNVEQMPDAAMQDPNNLLVQSPDGSFTEAGERLGLASLHRGRGAVLQDLNNDGQLDLAVVNRRAPLEIYQNEGNTGAWLSIVLQQPGTNPNAVGAHVELRSANRSWVQEVTIGGGHAGGSAGALHFGLGDLEEVELRVIWPDQRQGDWMRTGTRRHLILRPGATPKSR